MPTRPDALGGLALIGDILETHTYYDDPANGDPYTTTAVYDTEVDVFLRTERLTYEGSVLVAPGDPDYETGVGWLTASLPSLCLRLRL